MIGQNTWILPLKRPRVVSDLALDLAFQLKGGAEVAQAVQSTPGRQMVGSEVGQGVRLTYDLHVDVAGRAVPAVTGGGGVLLEVPAA